MKLTAIQRGALELIGSPDFRTWSALPMNPSTLRALQARGLVKGLRITAKGRQALQGEPAIGRALDAGVPEAGKMLGVRGGAVTSLAKAEAARRNGARGGRPRKVRCVG